MTKIERSLSTGWNDQDRNTVFFVEDDVMSASGLIPHNYDNKVVGILRNNCNSQSKKKYPDNDRDKSRIQSNFAPTSNILESLKESWNVLLDYVEPDIESGSSNDDSLIGAEFGHRGVIDGSASNSFTFVSDITGVIATRDSFSPPSEELYKEV